MSNDLQHALSATRDALALEVRDNHIQTGAGSDVTIEFFTQLVGTQTGSGFLAIDLGASPFGTGAITTQDWDLQAAATSPPKTGTPTETAQSFAIYDRATPTAVKILRGTVGETGGAGFDIEIAGGAAIQTNEKIKLNTFTYTAPV